MKISLFGRILALASVLNLVSCQSAVDVSSSESSLEETDNAELLASIPFENGYFIIEGDILVKDTAMALSMLGESKAPNAQLGKHVSLTTAVMQGAYGPTANIIKPTRWSSYEYCIDHSECGTRDLTQGLVLAADRWKSIIPVNLQYMPSQNGAACNATNANIDLVVKCASMSTAAGTGSFPKGDEQSLITVSSTGNYGSVSLEEQTGFFLHELGHVLGFAHEQARAEEGSQLYYGNLNATCNTEGQYLSHTPYDIYSIMQYAQCGDLRLTNNNLSAFDIQGAKKVYQGLMSGVPYRLALEVSSEPYNYFNSADATTPDIQVQSTSAELVAVADFNGDSQDDLVTVSKQYMDLHESVYSLVKKIRLKRYVPAGLIVDATPLSVKAVDIDKDGLKDVLVFYIDRVVVFKSLYPAGFAAGVTSIFPTTKQLRADTKIIIGGISTGVSLFVIQADSIGIVQCQTTLSCVIAKKPLPSGLTITATSQVKANASNMFGSVNPELILLLNDKAHLFKDIYYWSSNVAWSGYASRTYPGVSTIGIGTRHIEFGELVDRDILPDVFSVRDKAFYIFKNTGLDITTNSSAQLFTFQQVTMDLGFAGYYKNFSGDFDGDGLTDVVKMTGANFYIIPSRKGYTTVVPLTVSIPQGQPAVIQGLPLANWSATPVDVNGDGVMDVIRHYGKGYELVRTVIN